MTRNKPLITIIPLFIIVMSFLSIGEVQAQTSTNQPTCQIYHLTVEQARIRSCAGENCPVIGGASQYETLCIRGVAEDDADWLEIDLDPESEEDQNGFISRSLVVPGPPGVDLELFGYCDAWEVIPEEVIVRASPTSTSQIVSTLASGDQICVEEYYYLYSGWSAFTQPSTGQTGWVNTSNLRYVYDESLGCEESRELIANATIYTCAGRGCATNTSLSTGTRVCLTNEAEEEGVWVSYLREDAAGRNGWVRLDLLRPVDLEAQTVAQQPAVATENATAEDAPACVDYLVTSQTPVNVRSEAALSGQTIRAVNPGSVVCVIGTAGAANDWYAVNMTPEEENQTIGYVFGSLLQPAGESSQQVAAASTAPAAGQPTGTPAPLPTLAPLDGAPVVICPVGASPVQPGACVTATPTPLPIVQLDGNGLLLARNVNFSSLLFADTIEMASPQSRIQYFFSLPQDWVVSDPMTMQLNLNYVESLTEQTAANPQLSSQFTVRFNNEVVAFVNFNVNNMGQQVLEVPLPVRLLRPGTNFFEFAFNAIDYCNLNAQSRLTVNGETSYVTFVYEESLPIIDLAYYPRPFYNNPLRQDVKTTWLVIPDSPTDAELSALAGVAGGLGNLTENRLDVRVATVSELTPELWNNNNFIAIGRPDTNALIADLYQRGLLPSSYDGEQLAYNNVPIEADDGVVQIIAHPNNEARAVMVVTSQSDEGLLKASQSLAGPPALLSLTGDIAVVFETRALARTTGTSTGTPTPALYRLSDLGVENDIVLTGAGAQIASFDFQLPLGGTLREDAYIELLFSSSSILSSQDSSLNILVNGNPIAGVPLASTEMQGGVEQAGFRRMRAAIPSSAVSPGSNEIALLVDMKGSWGCNLPDSEVIWTTVSRDSLVFLPQNLVPISNQFATISQFPVPFNVLSNLEDLVIQMPETPSKVELQQLADLMGYLGTANPLAEGIRPLVNRGEFPEGTDLANYNFIVIGRPTNNSFLRDLNANLPQPFIDGTDDLEQVHDDVSYRLLPGLNIGILQILQSPWNSSRNILVISGTTEAGQVNAGDALIDLKFGSSALNGNITFATDTDATNVDTRFIYTPIEILEAIPELAGLAQFIPQPATPTPAVAVVVITATPPPTAVVVTPVTEPTSAATLIFTPTPADAFTTPLPEVQPLSAETLQQSIQVERPQWVTILIGVSVVLVALALLYNMVSTIWRRGNKDE